MTLSRSLFIAAGAGLAGLCLGLIVGDRPDPVQGVSQAESHEASRATMVIFAEHEDETGFVNALVTLFSAQGAMEIQVVDTPSPTRTVLSSVWPSESAARAAIAGDRFQSLTAVSDPSTSDIQVAIIPMDSDWTGQ